VRVCVFLRGVAVDAIHPVKIVDLPALPFRHTHTHMSHTHTHKERDMYVCMYTYMYMYMCMCIGTYLYLYTQYILSAHLCIACV